MPREQKSKDAILRQFPRLSPGGSDPALLFPCKSETEEGRRFCVKGTVPGCCCGHPFISGLIGLLLIVTDGAWCHQFPNRVPRVVPPGAGLPPWSWRPLSPFHAAGCPLAWRGAEEAAKAGSLPLSPRDRGLRFPSTSGPLSPAFPWARDSPPDVLRAASCPREPAQAASLPPPLPPQPALCAPVPPGEGRSPEGARPASAKGEARLCRAKREGRGPSPQGGGGGGEAASGWPVGPAVLVRDPCSGVEGDPGVSEE